MGANLWLIVELMMGEKMRKVDCKRKRNKLDEQREEKSGEEQEIAVGHGYIVTLLRFHCRLVC